MRFTKSFSFPGFTALLAAAAMAAPGQTPGVPGEKGGGRDGANMNYRLTPNDAVHVTVFGEEDMSATGRIGKDGAIPMPLLGLVKIAGLNVREAAQTVEGLLRKYLVKPQVAVAILEYSKRHFTILGQVGKPGIVEMPDETPLNLLEAIGMAGGYTRIANPSNITLKRLVDGQEKLMKLDAKKMANDGPTERFQILPGDMIVVGERLF